jgi:uncharacterized membrane protein YfcA
MNPLVIFSALAICLYRLTIEPGLSMADAYKDIAHVFVGGLFGAAIYGKSSTMRVSWKLYMWLGIAMTVLEVACGVIGKKTGKSIVGGIFSLFAVLLAVTFALSGGQAHARPVRVCDGTACRVVEEPTLAQKQARWLKAMPLPQIIQRPFRAMWGK